MEPPTIPVDATFFTSVACLPETVIIRVFSFVQLEQLVLLSKTCWLTRYLVRFYSIRVWSFSEFFRRWFPDSRAFQSMLGRSGAVISGSQVVQFFDRTYYPDSDLDIYVRDGHKLSGIVTWIGRQGYNLIDAGGSNYVNTRRVTGLHGTRRGGWSSSRPITRIFNFEKSENLWDGKATKKRVQVIGLSVPPLSHILFEFHSTAVVNFMTASVAVSVFPRLTFIDRVSLALKAPKKKKQGDETLPWQDKYKNRGFRVVHEGPASLLETELGKRSAVDSRAWKLPLSTLSLSPSARTVMADIERHAFEFELVSPESFAAGVAKIVRPHYAY